MIYNVERMQVQVNILTVIQWNVVIHSDTKGHAIVSVLSGLSEKNVLAQTHFLLILRYNRAVIEAESQGSEACVFK